LKKELGIFTYNDLLHHFPYRHLDKTKVLKMSELNTSVEYAQVQGYWLIRKYWEKRLPNAL
jgi:ATP-dependent DNA helicase RecG